MNIDNMTFSREQLEQMATERLDEILNRELKETLPDGDLVRNVLDILEKRECGYVPEFSAEINDAWTNYLNRQRSQRNRLWQKSWFLRMVAAIAVICILFSMVPQTVEAEGLFERLARWTDNFFQMFRSVDEKEQTLEYEFRTDNPGLQQVYDTVTALGITEPIVPMWMPGNGDLVSLDKVHARNVYYVVAVFGNDEAQDTMYQVTIYLKNAPSEFPKDPVNAEIYEFEGTDYHVVPNDGKWTVAYTKDNVECFVIIKCQEEELYKMIESIHMMEVN